MKKTVLAIIVILVLGGAAYWALRLRSSDAVRVTTNTVQRRAVFESFVTASGEVVATRYADIGSSIMGRLVELRVSEGAGVRAGQTLAVIDPIQAESNVAAQEAQIRTLEAEQRISEERVRTARAELLAARARSREAAESLARAEKLIAAGVAPPAGLDAARAADDTARAQLAAAEIAITSAERAMEAARRRISQAEAAADGVRDVLSKTRITAPIDGIVSRLQVRQGEMVVIGIQNQPGTTLMTISDMSSVDAEVKVAEADVVQIQVDQPARVTLEALPGVEFSGKVVEVGASALPTSGAAVAAREFKVVIRLQGPVERLKPGLTCDVEILVHRGSGTLTVPLQAVVLRPQPEGTGETTGVFALRDGRARFVPVEAGIIGGLDIEVSGIAEGETVISGPVQVLRGLEDGSEVEAGPNP